MRAAAGPHICGFIPSLYCSRSSASMLRAPRVGLCTDPGGARRLHFFPDELRGVASAGHSLVLWLLSSLHPTISYLFRSWKHFPPCKFSFDFSFSYSGACVSPPVPCGEGSVGGPAPRVGARAPTTFDLPADTWPINHTCRCSWSRADIMRLV